MLIGTKTRTVLAFVDTVCTLSFATIIHSVHKFVLEHDFQCRKKNVEIL